MHKAIEISYISAVLLGVPPDQYLYWLLIAIVVRLLWKLREQSKEENELEVID